MRRLVYYKAYTDEEYAGRRMANGITLLAGDWPDLYGRHPWLKPRPVLLEKVNGP